ncbi:MAG: endonuclease/exonuclease/phosphatase family protein [Myxococcota bacterium]
MKLAALVLSVLSYNVHGLASILVDDDPEARMPRISSRLNAYDVALIQESWTYGEALAASATHPVKERSGEADPGLFFQSGLALFARPPLRAVTRAPLGACAGWLGGANDCFAHKGFLRVRLELASGVEVDFWTLHLDAGGDESDRAARAIQLDRLAARVREISSDGPLVIAGDFNLQESNAADHALLERFSSGLALRDSGARASADGAFPAKHIDYILYRSGAGVALEPLEVGEAREFSDGPTPLSDHPALFARFAVSAP